MINPAPPLLSLLCLHTTAHTALKKLLLWFVRREEEEEEQCLFAAYSTIPAGMSHEQYHVSARSVPQADTAAAITNARVRTKAPRRCRQCGHPYGSGQSHGKFHVGAGKRDKHQKSYESVCKVPKEEWLPGFPLKEGQPMPRRSRAKKNLGGSNTIEG